MSVTALSPGYVAETGMWAEHRHAPHWLTGESPPQRVVDGLLRALDRREEEVVVNPQPMGPMLALHALAPGAVEALLRRSGFLAFTRSVQTG